MHFEYAYMVVIILLLSVGVFYLSPYELTVNEEESDD
ncbi:cell division protein FtsL [Mucilaginibacter sp. UYCu711]